jgi:methyltransferase (TIGR00027 family)
MQAGRPSETAYRAAMARARHQVLDDPKVFDDPVAVRFLRADDADALKRKRGKGSPLAQGMRYAIAARSRITEDALHACVARGVRQYVVLGAGLDTFAFRSPYDAATLRVFEVDHPSTQQDKQRAAREAGLVTPPSLSFVPVDLARDDAWKALEAAGFDAGAPAFFGVLGVSVYIDESAWMETLSSIAREAAKGSEIVFDYVVAPSTLGWLDRMFLRWTARRCARVGEPWVTYLDPEALPGRMRALGFSAAQNLHPAAFATKVRAEHKLDPASRPPRFGIGRMMHATV